MEKQSDIERAYRRGVHQALHLLDDFLHTHWTLDPMSVLDVAADKARQIRFSHEDAPLLLHMLFKEVWEYVKDDA